MAESILEQIATNIVTTVKGITAQAGYQITVTEVERFKKTGNRFGDGRCIVHQGLALKDDAPYSHSAWKQTFGIEYQIQESENSETPIDTRINAGRSSIEKALMVDPHRGALAVDTIIQEPSFIDDDEGGLSGVVVVFEVHYRTLKNDPYTQ